MISGRRGNRFRYLALTALAVLLACALFTLNPTEAAPPDDLELELSFYRDSDGVAQPGSTIQVQAELKFTGAESVGALPVSDVALRIAGDLEWDVWGRRSIPGQDWSPVTQEYRGATGEAVAVDGMGANTIQVVGAPDATVNGIPGGGAVHVWVNGFYRQRLTGEPSDGGAYPQGYRRLNGGFGLSVDVGNGVIVVGAPHERGSEPSGGLIGPGLGAAYVFERNDDDEWERTAKLTVGDNPSFDDIGYRFVPTGFGGHVAISDDGETVVVSQLPSPALGADDNWGASAHVFSRPNAGWTDMDTNHANVTSLRYDSNGAAADDAGVVNARRDANGDVDIAGDGSVVAVGASRLPYTMLSNEAHETGAVLVFDRPTSGWTAESDRLLEQNATLTATDHEHRNVQVGSDVAISESGEVIVSNGTMRLINTGVYDMREPVRDPVIGWPGSAFVWERPSGGWADSNSATATLSDSAGQNGDQFGASVAVSDSGDRVVVSDTHFGRRSRFVYNDETTLPAIHVFDEPGGGWTNASTADPILRHGAAWGGVRSLAIDGELTLLVGTSGLGGWLLDLSQPAPQVPVRALSSDCGVSRSNGVITHTCPLYFPQRGVPPSLSFPTITIPDGTPDGEFTVSASAMVDGVRYSDAITISVREVDEVAEVTFDFATHDGGTDTDTSDDRPYWSSIAHPVSTRLRLSVLNDNGKASGPDAADGISEILFTTTAGNFSSGASLPPVQLIGSFGPLAYRDANCEGGNGQPTCSVDLTNLSAENADRIVITLAHPGPDKPGVAQVRATVITNDGEVFNPPPISVTFLGAAESLVISEPTASILNVDAPPDGGAETDDRDVLALSVTALDKNGKQTDVPVGLLPNPTREQRSRAVRVTVRDPDGDIVPASRYGGWDWTYDTDQERISLDFKLQINASEENALDSGEYTLELRIGGLKAERAFRVSGGPASLTLGEPEGAFEPNGQFTITAAVADAEGNPVPDGTAVRWESRSVASERVVLVQLAADRTTTAGNASASYLAIGPGTAVVAAQTSGDMRDAALLTIADPSAVVIAGGSDAPPAAGLSSRTPGFSTWLGGKVIAASALLDSLAGIDSISLWQYGRWLRYERSDGRIVPGSFDFTIMPGDVLSLGE